MVLLYIIFVVLNSIVLSTAGINVMTWQYWVSLICVIGTFIVGRSMD